MSSFKGITDINDALFTEQVIDNLSSYFDWNLLGIGGFFNVKKRTDSTLDNFQVADDPNYAFGQVWECPRANWVWETGVPYNPQPTHFSGIYVNNQFLPEGSGYHINYPLGQIVFDDPQNVGDTVQAEYAYRMYNFYNADVPWFQQVIFGQVPESGVRSIFARNRIELPAVLIEAVPNQQAYGYELGDFTLEVRKDVIFHILSDGSNKRDKLVDVMTNLKDQTFWMYDLNKIADANRFSLDDYGSVASGALTYPDLVTNYLWKKCLFENVRSQEISRQLPLFRATVRATLLMYLP